MGREVQGLSAPRRIAAEPAGHDAAAAAFSAMEDARRSGPAPPPPGAPAGPVRALVVTNLYPSRSRPTYGLFNLSTFRALSSSCDLRLVVPVPWWCRTRHPADVVRTPSENSTGVEAAFPTYWSLPRVGLGLHARAMRQSLLPYLTRLRNEFPFDVILAAWAYPDVVAAAWLAQDLQCPLVSMVLGSDINDLAQRPALREQIVWALEQSHRVVAVSGALRDRVVSLGIPAERVIVQHNGVDGERFAIADRRPARARLGLPLDAKIIGFVGNLVWEKGVEVLLDALSFLRDSGRRDVELAVIGDGVLGDRLRARARQLRIDRYVRFCGRQLHGEIPDWITAFDLLCLPSRREGCPNVILEALASGRPVVASRVGGIPELLRAENGLMAPPDDAAALASALREALDRTWDPEALRDTVPFLSWNEFGATLTALLADAARSPRPSRGSALPASRSAARRHD